MDTDAIPLILLILKNEDSCGYEIVKRVNECTNGAFRKREAFIYPVLKKMIELSMLKSFWKFQQGQRPRKYYSILAEGKKQLEQNMDKWHMSNSIFRSLCDHNDTEK